MRKSIHSPEYRRVLAALVDMRRKAGLTQRDLAKKLGREHSFVWRIETGERRLDVIEFHWVCQALGQDAAAVYRNLIRALDAVGQASAQAPGDLPPPTTAGGLAAEPAPAYRSRKPNAKP